MSPKPESFAAAHNAAFARRDLRAALGPAAHLRATLARMFGGAAPIDAAYLDRLARAVKAIRPEDCLDAGALARYFEKAMGGAVLDAVAAKVKGARRVSHR